jgi:hypothetical protein
LSSIDWLLFCLLIAEPSCERRNEFLHLRRALVNSLASTRLHSQRVSVRVTYAKKQKPRPMEGPRTLHWRHTGLRIALNSFETVG